MLSTSALVLAALLAQFPTDTDLDHCLDNYDAFPCDSSLQGVAYAPARDTFGLLLFEDMWPKDGDLDFNDAVLAYNYRFGLAFQGGLAGSPSSVRFVQLNLQVMASGAGLHNAVLLRLPIPRSAVDTATLNFSGEPPVALAVEPGEPDAVLRLVPDIRDLFGGVQYANTISGGPALPTRTLNVIIRLSANELDASLAPFDLFLARTSDDGHQVHLPQFAGTARMDTALFGTGDDRSTPSRHFVNKRGLPFALHVPIATEWPAEFKPIDRLYPDIVRFAASGGAEALDWYETRTDSAYAWTCTGPAPQATSVGPSAAHECPAGWFPGARPGMYAVAYDPDGGHQTRVVWSHDDGRLPWHYYLVNGAVIGESVPEGALPAVAVDRTGRIVLACLGGSPYWLKAIIWEPLSPTWSEENVTVRPVPEYGPYAGTVVPLAAAADDGGPAAVAWTQDGVTYVAEYGPSGWGLAERIDEYTSISSGLSLRYDGALLRLSWTDTDPVTGQLVPRTLP